jgi:hypothetical protein
MGTSDEQARATTLADFFGSGFISFSERTSQPF